MNDTKRCSCCKESKPLTEFSKLASRPDGLHYYCRECKRSKAKDWKSNNRERVNKNQKMWMKRNKAHCRHWATEYRKRIKLHREEVLELLKAKLEEQYKDVP